MSSPGGEVGPERFVGRSGELAELCGWLGQAKAGCGRVVLVSGPAGIGKTRLAEEAAAAATAMGARGRVPEPAPTSFVPARGRGYRDVSRRDGHGAAHRPYRELGGRYRRQAALRAADGGCPARLAHRPGRAAAASWAARRDDFCALTDVDPDPDAPLARHRAALPAAPRRAGTGARRRRRSSSA